MGMPIVPSHLLQLLQPGELAHIGYRPSRRLF